MQNDNEVESRKFLVENSPLFGERLFRLVFLTIGVIVFLGMASLLSIFLWNNVWIGDPNRAANPTGLCFLLIGILVPTSFVAHGLADRYPDITVTDAGIRLKILWRERQIDWTDLYAVSHRVRREAGMEGLQETRLIVYSDKLPVIYSLVSASEERRCFYVARDARRRDAFEFELEKRKRLVTAVH